MIKEYILAVTYGYPHNAHYFIATDTIQGTLAEINSEIEKRYSDSIDKGIITDIRLSIYTARAA